jgi:hypothetical protein
MNIFTELLFIFIFIYLIIILKFPDTSKDDYIFQRFSLFISIFCFYFIIKIISKIRHNCKIHINEILNDSLLIAICGVLGYTLYTDLIFMSSTREFMEYMIIPNVSRYTNALIITMSIISFIAMIKIIQLLFITSDQYFCIK